MPFVCYFDFSFLCARRHFVLSFCRMRTEKLSVLEANPQVMRMYWLPIWSDVSSLLFNCPEKKKSMFSERRRLVNAHRQVLASLARRLRSKRLILGLWLRNQNMDVYTRRQKGIISR